MKIKWGAKSKITLLTYLYIQMFEFCEKVDCMDKTVTNFIAATF